MAQLFYVIILLLLNFITQGQQSKMSDHFFSNWISKDTGVSINSERMSRLYGNDSVWIMTTLKGEVIKFIDTPNISSNKLFESWGAHMSTLIQYFTNEEVRATYTGIYCLYRLELIDSNTLKLSMSKFYKLRQERELVPYYVPGEIKEKQKLHPEFERSIILKRLVK